MYPRTSGTQVPRYRAFQPAKPITAGPSSMHQPGEPQPEAGEPEPWHSWATAPSPVPPALCCHALPCHALPCLALSCPVLSTPLHWTGLGLASFGVGDWSPFQNRPCRRRFVLSSPNLTGASLDKASTRNLAALISPPALPDIARRPRIQPLVPPHLPSCHRYTASRPR